MSILRTTRSIVRKPVAILIAMSAAFMFALPAPVFAETVVSEFFKKVIFEVILWPVVQLLNYAIFLLVDVAQYNDFASAPIVEKGWLVLRDLSNMFFVLILLIIAISSIVKWQKVNYRQNLRRLILMAILINFSKTIVIFMIDLSQVITLTFISAVNDVMQAGVITALGLDKIISPVSGGAITNFAGDMFTYVLGALMICTACIVIIAILMIFVMRIIALWMVIIFSPLAFVASTLPQTEEWYHRWWKIFGSNLTVAPTLAFMLWLVFAVVADPKNGGQIKVPVNSTTVGGLASGDFVGFLIGIGLLLYSIRLAVQMGAAGASVASSFSGKMQGYAKGIGKRLSVGRSGSGGALGYARAGLTTAVTRPGDAIRGAVGIAGRLADVGTGGIVGALPVRFGVKPPEGAGRFRRAAARVVPQLGTFGSLRREVRGGAAAVGRGFDEKFAAPLRGKFEAAEGFIPRQMRRGMRALEVGERESQRQRASAAGKAMETEQMTFQQLRDELQTGSPFFDARKAASARELMNRGEIDRLKFGPTGKDLTDEQKAQQTPGQRKAYEAEVAQGTALAARATQFVMQDSGLTPEETSRIKERNLRNFDMSSPDTQETIKTMLIEGKSFSRSDLTDNATVSAIYKLGSQTLSGPEFKKLVEKLPKQSKPAALEGMKGALKDLVVKADVEMPDAVAREKHNNKMISDREKIRSQMIRLDPDSIKDFSKDFIEVKDARTGKSEVKFAEAPASDETIAKNVRALGVKNLSDMSEATLEDIGKHLSATNIIKADGHEDFTAAKSESLQRGFILNFKEGDRNMEATFKSIFKNTILGPRFTGLIEEGNDKEAAVPEEERKFKKAFDYLKKLESDKGSGRKKDGDAKGEDGVRGAFE